VGVEIELKKDDNMPESVIEIIFRNIDKSYIVKLKEGRSTRKGSFWALDNLGNRFYISPNLVEENKELIENLEQRKVIFWSLIQDVVWGGRWGDQQVKSVMMIALDETNCEKFKNGLLEYWKLRMKSTDNFTKAIDLISIEKNQNITNQDLLYSKELTLTAEEERIKALEKKAELDFLCKGWVDIDR
jgi:hypothetical protein